MSYKKPDTGNPMNNFITRPMDFHRLSHHLLKAETTQEFEIWLDKLARIDRRSLILFIRTNREQIPEPFMARAETRLGKKWFTQKKQNDNTVNERK